LLIAGVAVVVAVTALTIRQTGRTGEDAEAAALTHVHGLGVNPADGWLFVATHDGLYQLPSTGGVPRLAGTSRQDTMGFTVVGPNRFLASGHPGPGEEGPRHLGLLESVDAGATWTAVSLSGQADFHTLRFRHSTVYGYNSASGQLMASTDRITWQVRATMPVSDFDVHPADLNILLATTPTGLQRSQDGGRTWNAAAAPSLRMVTWENPDRLWAVTTTGDVVRSADGGIHWLPAGSLAGQVTALAAHEGILYASVHDRGLYRSGDGGITWNQIYRQTS
jgi:hypothetical protein